MGTTNEGGVATAVALLASGMGWGPDNGKRGGLEKSVSGGVVTGGWAEVKKLFQIIVVLLLQIITTNTLHGMVACPWRGRKRAERGWRMVRCPERRLTTNDGPRPRGRERENE